MNTYKVTAVMYTHLECEFEAESIEDARLKAGELDGANFSEIKNSGDWKTNFDEITLVKGKEPAPPFSHIRVYHADTIECNNCDNYEEGSSPWGSFTYHNEPWRDNEGTEQHGYHTCNNCGSSCIKESEITEYRDFE